VNPRHGSTPPRDFYSLPKQSVTSARQTTLTGFIDGQRWTQQLQIGTPWDGDIPTPLHEGLCPTASIEGLTVAGDQITYWTRSRSNATDHAHEPPDLLVRITNSERHVVRAEVTQYQEGQVVGRDQSQFTAPLPRRIAWESRSNGEPLQVDAEVPPLTRELNAREQILLRQVLLTLPTNIDSVEHADNNYIFRHSITPPQGPQQPVETTISVINRRFQLSRVGILAQDASGNATAMIVFDFADPGNGH